MPSPPAGLTSKMGEFTSTMSEDQAKQQIVPKFTQRVALPSEIRLPVNISILVGLPRTIVLRHGTAVPVAVLEFMLTDPRYKNWFAENPLQNISESTAPSVPPSEAPVGPEASVPPATAEASVLGDGTDETPVEESVVVVVKKKGKS